MSQGFADPNARMEPVHDFASLTNVGAAWALDAYTVPAGRVFALDGAQLVCFSGTLPTALLVRLVDGSAVVQAELLRKPEVLHSSAIWDNTVWLSESWKIRFQTTGGAADTDVVWSFSGRLFYAADIT